jgi:hypothetical protein
MYGLYHPFLHGMLKACIYKGNTSFKLRDQSTEQYIYGTLKSSS